MARSVVRAERSCFTSSRTLVRRCHFHRPIRRPRKLFVRNVRLCYLPKAGSKSLRGALFSFIFRARCLGRLATDSRSGYRGGMRIDTNTNVVDSLRRPRTRAGVFKTNPKYDFFFFWLISSQRAVRQSLKCCSWILLVDRTCQ